MIPAALCLVSYKTGCTCRIFCLDTHNTAASNDDFKCVHEESSLQSSLCERAANRGGLAPKQRRAFGVWLLALCYTTLFILHELGFGLSLSDLFLEYFARSYVFQRNESYDRSEIGHSSDVEDVRSGQIRCLTTLISGLNWMCSDIRSGQIGRLTNLKTWKTFEVSREEIKSKLPWKSQSWKIVEIPVQKE